MTINFELLNARKMSNLRIHISPVMKKLEALNLNSRVNLKGLVLLGTLSQKELRHYPYSRDFDKSLYLVSGATVIRFG